MASVLGEVSGNLSIEIKVTAMSENCAQHSMHLTREILQQSLSVQTLPPKPTQTKSVPSPTKKADPTNTAISRCPTYGQPQHILNIANNQKKSAEPELLRGDIPETEFLPKIPMIVDDLNGDGKSDVFLAIGSLDANPFPGHQNMLLLSNAEGKLVNATAANLPQLNDFPRSVSGADIDNDGNIDLYVGNKWA